MVPDAPDTLPHTTLIIIALGKRTSILTRLSQSEGVG